MQLLVILGFIFFVIAVFVRQVRRRRQRWLRSLALPGTWRMERLTEHPDQPAHIQMLDLRGQLNEGEYRLVRSASELADSTETGHWQLEGTIFRLRSTAGTTQGYNLKLLEPRLVGLQHRESGDAYYLHRDASNVVPLRPTQSIGGRG